MNITTYTPNMIAVEITPTTRHMIINTQQHRLTPPRITISNTMSHIHAYYSLQDMNQGIQHELLHNPTYRHLSNRQKIATCKHYQKELTKEYLTLMEHLKTISTPDTRILHQWIQHLEANYLTTSELWDNMITYYQHHLAKEEAQNNGEDTIRLI